MLSASSERLLVRGGSPIILRPFQVQYPSMYCRIICDMMEVDRNHLIITTKTPSGELQLAVLTSVTAVYEGFLKKWTKY